MEDNLPSSYYRVSAKALILDENREKFLVTLEDNGFWEIPGGGLDHGESPQECIAREIKEEMGLEVIEVATIPSYCLSGKNIKGRWSLNIVFETKVGNLEFTPSEECCEIRFISPEEVHTINAFRNVQELAEQFDRSRH